MIGGPEKSSYHGRWLHAHMHVRLGRSVAGELGEVT
jgi:hypothetical protein